MPEPNIPALLEQIEALPDEARLTVYDKTGSYNRSLGNSDDLKALAAAYRELQSGMRETMRYFKEDAGCDRCSHLDDDEIRDAQKPRFKEKENAG